MHDTVWFEIQGLPAVAIASTEFYDAAKIQAEALGMSDAKRIFVQHPIQDATIGEINDKADKAVVAVIDALSGNKNEHNND
ncbi:hypothetical protein OAL10_02660 [Gammaproteobacteria bacterium]|nr:hypothetical protein [Gammaproteobacteria bacterium]